MGVPLVQPLLRLPRMRDHVRRLPRLPALELHAHRRPMVIAPGGLDQHMATMTVAGFRDRAFPLALPARNPRSRPPLATPARDPRSNLRARPSRDTPRAASVARSAASRRSLSPAPSLPAMQYRGSTGVAAPSARASGARH